MSRAAAPRPRPHSAFRRGSSAGTTSAAAAAASVAASGASSAAPGASSPSSVAYVTIVTSLASVRLSARPPPRAAKLRPRAQTHCAHARATRTRARRALRSATMFAMRHWLGFGSQNTAEGAGTASSGGALAALADAASGGACLCALARTAGSLRSTARFGPTSPWSARCCPPMCVRPLPRVVPQLRRLRCTNAASIDYRNVIPGFAFFLPLAFETEGFHTTDLNKLLYGFAMKRATADGWTDGAAKKKAGCWTDFYLAQSVRYEARSVHRTLCVAPRLCLQGRGEPVFQTCLRGGRFARVFTAAAAQAAAAAGHRQRRCRRARPIKGTPSLLL